MDFDGNRSRNRKVSFGYTSKSFVKGYMHEFLGKKNLYTGHV